MKSNRKADRLRKGRMETRWAFEVKERLKNGLIPENERKALRDLSNPGISLGSRH